MGRAPCCDKENVKKGPWSPEEDAKLKEYIEKYGTGGNWIALPQKVGLRRCGKSCRLRWLNYLRPNIKHGDFSEEEDRIICSLFASIGSRWSIIAAQLPGRTDNDIKNYWNTKLKKKLFAMVSSSHQHRKPPPLPFKDSFFGFLGGPISYPSSNDLPNNNNNNNNTSNLDVFQAPKEESFVDHPILQYNYSMNNNNNNLFMFGGSSTDNNNQGSCCSTTTNSDGSCSQISYGKEMIIIKQEEIMGFINQQNIPNHHDFQEEGAAHKFILSNYGINNNNNGGSNVINHHQWSDHPHHHVEDEKQNEGYAFLNPNNNNPLGYDLEQVLKQQLMITSNNSTTNGCDIDNKTQQEKVMHYY